MLKEPEGMWLCDTFAVESGYAGLSFVLPYAFELMFPYEFALAQRFSGVMVDSLGTLEGGGGAEKCLLVYHCGYLRLYTKFLSPFSDTLLSSFVR